jgi:hypothetical protein
MHRCSHGRTNPTRFASALRTLSSCCVLHCAQNVRVCSAPPKGLALPSLQAILGVRLACPASATGQLLRALPKLCRLDITRCDSQALEGAERQGVSASQGLCVGVGGV